MKKGSFIVFEGIDGCGKSTQLKRLQAYLAARGQSCRTEREPTDGPVGSLVRSAVENRTALRDETLVLLFAADRYEHVQQLMAALSCGETVLCDRYVCSSLAYQSLTESPDFVAACNEKATSLLLPDVTLFIDTPPEECMRRIEANRSQLDRFETLDKLRAVRENFLRAFSRYRLPVLQIDGRGSADEVEARVREGLGQTFPAFKA